MGSIVAGLGVSHAPGITAWPENADPDRLRVVHDGFSQLRRVIEEARPDAIVFVTPEHCVNFSLANMPAFCIGVAKNYRGPVEPWIRIPEAVVPGQPELGELLVDCALRDGVDVSFSHELKLDHATMVPLSFLTPAFDIPVVPIIQNCLVEPMPHPWRSQALGESIGRAIRESERDWRVVVLGSGGLSHWPAEVEHGQVNEDFDRRFLHACRAGNWAEMGTWTHEEIAEGGTGAAAVRNWITMAAAARLGPMEVVFYEPMSVFATGLTAAYAVTA